MEILTNAKKNNHYQTLYKLAAKADTLIIVSPFVTDDISKLIESMTTIKNITLYTTLQKYDDTAQKAIALYKFYEYCKGKSIDLLHFTTLSGHDSVSERPVSGAYRLPSKPIIPRCS